ncbi:aspartate aminotransferase family protein [Chelatococcus sambhunathii]|uniref:Aspartate aminotransferase family protein n=1 Tax=Chelatococcus sambhunathii TaxID=363953 RepID=A0ABU1DL37_9HYPH|nr:aspartate aminotransferase family protein [Chelatococcus sambhunathii]MDR4308832.1 aspartate aminotransferase family protein [Chelatococcus sambhunathii]
MQEAAVLKTSSADEDRPFDVAALIAEREPERYALHTQHLNEMMVKVLQTIGYDVGFRRGHGQYLYDRQDVRYLDLLSGWGVFGVGRNHPTVRDALQSVLASDLPNLVQMDVPVLAALLAEKLLQHTPFLDKAFFCNSGAEAVEAAIKFARRTTNRPGVVYCDHAFHGLTYGALSLNGDAIFRDGFGETLPGCVRVPFNDLAALERALSTREIAAFIVEPIQGKGVNLPDDGYLAGAQALCRKYGTLFVADEIQTGLGRTGKFLAIEHWGVEPDMVLIAKALSGGHVPVGVVLAKKPIFDKVFSRMDKAVVHGSTFAKNDLAMAAGLATLEVIGSERLIEKAAATGARLISFFEGLTRRYEMVREVRGKGLMIGVEFGAPQSLKLRAAWSLLETVNTGLFCQLITIPLFKEHKILAQVAGHASHTIKLLPTMVMTDADCDWIERGFEATVAESHKVPGAVWSLGKTLADHALKARAAR